MFDKILPLPFQKTTISQLYRIVIFMIFLAILVLFPSQGLTQQKDNIDCSEPYKIEQTFNNNAKWDMCWEWRPYEGIVLHNVFYTTPDQVRRKVLGELAPAELHVKYDMGQNSYFDMSREGLGLNLADLREEECINGTRHAQIIPLKYDQEEERNVLCETSHDYGYRWRTIDGMEMGTALELHSVSEISLYQYIYKYSFYDDGRIEISIGASGNLEEYTAGTDFETFGWNMTPEKDGWDSIAISHIHTYWFRIDFDIDGAENDVVREHDFYNFIEHLDQRIPQYKRKTTEFITETARPISPESWRIWDVQDTKTVNDEGHPISYRIEPNHSAIYRNTKSFAWADNDLYVTKYNPCERWLVNNSPTDEECGDNILSYMTGDDIEGEDIVVWYGTSFHHLPRDEDQPYMPTEWTSFHLIPADWQATSPDPLPTPVPTNTPEQIEPQQPFTPTATAEISATVPIEATPIIPTVTTTDTGGSPPTIGVWGSVLGGASLLLVGGTILLRNRGGKSIIVAIQTMSVRTIYIFPAFVLVFATAFLVIGQSNPYNIFAPRPLPLGTDPLSTHEITVALDTVSANDTWELLVVERHKGDKTDDVRKADLYYYDYSADELQYYLVDLTEKIVTYQQSYPDKQLPLTDNEVEQVRTILQNDPTTASYFAQEYAKWSEDELDYSELLLTPFISIEDEAYPQCGMQRCAMIRPSIIVEKQQGFITTPIVNLSTQTVEGYK